MVSTRCWTPVPNTDVPTEMCPPAQSWHGYRGVVNCFLVEFKSCSTAGFHAWNSNLGQKLLAGAVPGPRVEAAIVALLNRRVKNRLLSVGVYTHRSGLFSSLAGEAPFYNRQQ